MNTKTKSENREQIKLNTHAVAGAVAMLLLLPVSVRGAGVVTECTESNLRAAMAGGGTVTFACDGTINLSSTITNTIDTLLDGSGHQVTISGSNTVRVFYLSPSNAFTLIHLTIANGREEDGGAGIFNDRGALTLLGVTMQANSTIFGFSDLGGGAILNCLGTLCATNCIFSGNLVIPQPGLVNTGTGAGGRGGAIHNLSGRIDLENCSFGGNSAYGFTPMCGFENFSGTAGRGGAICNAGTVVANRCIFVGNGVGGGNGCGLADYQWKGGGYGGDGCGGAIDNTGDLTLLNSTFSGNGVHGGNGGTGSRGNPYVDVNFGGNGGRGFGGAVCNNGTAKVIGCTLSGNVARGGLGGEGGVGSMDHSLPIAYPGGPGGLGGNGCGGALYNGNTMSLVNCTLFTNAGFGGDGGRGGHGADNYSDRPGGDGGWGGSGGQAAGALWDAKNSCRITNCTIAFNAGTGGIGGAGGACGISVYGGRPGSPGQPGTNGVAGGGVWTKGATLANTLLSSSSPVGNCIGWITNAGHNLSSDGSCAFTNVGSLNNTDPKLGPLANNGGPTLTMALLPGSPAIDGGDAAAPTTDQRGHPRPVGMAADIGAYEYGTTPRLRIGFQPTGTVEILLYDASGQSCRLFTSTTLSNWQCVATNQIGADGTVLFQDNCAAGATQRFYRVALP